MVSRCPWGSRKDGCDHLEAGYPGVAIGLVLASQGLSLWSVGKFCLLAQLIGFWAVIGVAAFVTHRDP
uniref:TISP78 protein n=1 Tax=Mus musculus TaxID=10090 RepID=Q8K4U3_MOUSE|nr:TISP78 [Mus musculus]